MQLPHVAHMKYSNDVLVVPVLGRNLCPSFSFKYTINLCLWSLWLVACSILCATGVEGDLQSRWNTSYGHQPLLRGPPH
jgi:hypothetical protein